MQQITQNVYFESGFKGCNTGLLVTSEGLAVIDTPMVPSEAKKWRQDISHLGEIRYVINNEPHPDHIAGNCWMGGTLVSHNGSYQEILSTRVETIRQMLKFMAPDNLPLDPDFRFRPPEITFSDRLTLHLGKHTLQLIHLPGHHPFQIATFVPEERVVFTSDNVTRLPIFISAVPYQWLESLKKLKALDVDKILPGHGEVCEKSYLDSMIEAVQYWIDTVKTAINQGLSLEEMQNKVDLSARYGAEINDPRTSGILRGNLEHLYSTLLKSK